MVSAPKIPESAFIVAAETSRADTGELAGVRLAVKDNIDVAGMPTGAGHPDWARTHTTPDHDADVVRQLTAAGAHVVGKTHTDELAYSLAGTNVHYGTLDNPAAPGHLPGGSSCGSAVAVASGSAELALGTDTAGSIRVPASWCGLFGLRPSHDRVSARGIVPLAPTFDVAGLLARDLSLLARAAPILCNTVSARPPESIIVATDLWTLADRAVRDALQPALATLCSRLTRSDRSVTADALGGRDYVAAFTTIQAWEFWQAHGEWVRHVQPTFGPNVGRRVRAASLVSADQADAARREARDIAGWLIDLVGDAVLVVPTTPTVAPRRGHPAGDVRARLLALTVLAPLAGLPALSIPAGAVAGCPAGLTVIGAPGSDEALLRLGQI